ncbi:HIT domain-containing protein [Pararhizobium haloflavum]|uniref:HIT domain-containing protein n=1 Tax=Pararhizobium haloflavum TaxID=2037914 RepID=UPI000C174933|nr:HIT family protein [Pararhizobium haloflavum]
MTKWTLDPRLERDTLPMTSLGLCAMRLMNDRRWPWMILVPQRADILELHDLTPLDQTMLTFEMSLAAKAMKTATGCQKLNIGALGNMVSQLHIHVVARNEGDPAWPGPVWGHGTGEPYDHGDDRAIVTKILDQL